MTNNTNFKKTEIGLVPEDWEVVILGSEINIIGGGTPKTSIKEFWDGEIPWISVVDFVGSKRWIYDTEKHITQKGLEKSSTKLLHKNQLIISARGTVGELGQVTRDMAFNQSCYGIDGKGSFDNNFLYHLLKHKVSEFIGKGHGAVFNTITKNTFNQILVAKPKIKEQSAIAKILLDLDSKIELLQKQNETLEKIGQAIFKQWFVDFEFPNEQGNPYKSSGGKMIESELGEIPKGWSVGYLDDNRTSELIKTGINEFQGEKIYLATACVEKDNIIDSSTKITKTEKPSRANMQPIENSIWFAKMKDSKKILLINSYDEWILNNVILSTGFSGVKPKNNMLYYLWNIINSDLFETKKDSFCLGTTMQAINNTSIRKIKYLVPSDNILNLFNQILTPNYRTISNNKEEIVSLRKTRDLLLPKLMTGKIRVPLEVKG